MSVQVIEPQAPEAAYGKKVSDDGGSPRSRLFKVSFVCDLDNGDGTVRLNYGDALNAVASSGEQAVEKVRAYIGKTGFRIWPKTDRKGVLRFMMDSVIAIGDVDLA